METLPPLTVSMPVRSLSFAIAEATVHKNSVSSLLDSTKLSQRKCAPISNSGSSNKKGKVPSSDNDKENAGTDPYKDDEKVNEKDIDYIPVTDSAKQCTKDVMDLKDSVESKELTELHCKVFMERAFPPETASKTYSNTQKKSGSILACRPQAEMDYIVYVIKNW